MTGPELVSRAYCSYTGDVVLLELDWGFKKDCFGKYGYHKSFGPWKWGNQLFPQSPYGRSKLRASLTDPATPLILLYINIKNTFK